MNSAQQRLQAVHERLDNSREERRARRGCLTRDRGTHHKRPQRIPWAAPGPHQQRHTNRRSRDAAAAPRHSAPSSTMRRGPAWAPINAPEDAVSRAREEKQIRTFFRRVKKVGPVTDTSAPRGYGLPHFQQNTKAIEDKLKWQNKISHENQILMKSIVHIMENGTPLSQKPDMARVRLRRNMAYNKAITDKIKKDELRKHNRYFAGRLRKTQATPSTSHASHAKFYEDQAYYRRNMGRAVRMKPLGKRASTGTVVTGESSVQDQEYAELRKIADSVDLTRETLKTPGLKLLTAKQIRDDTAKAHGYELLPEHSRMFLPIAMASALKAPKGDYGDRLRE